VKAAKALCPAGKRVLGGGAMVFDGGWAEEVSIAYSMPVDGNSWIIGAHEIESHPGPWQLTTYAVCANVAP
jgi:hypothetical protein